MVSKKSSKIGTCVYCGKNGLFTDDHIPPKNLFGEPRPNYLITVPACADCNSSFSKDDEYFRLSITIREDIFDKTQDIYPKVIRSLKKPKKIGFRKNFLSTIRPFEDISDAGIFRGYKYSYNVDMQRLNNVAARIIKGMFYYHFKKIIPRGCVVDAFCIDGMKKMPERDIINLQDNILVPISKQKLYSVEPVFEYKYVVNKEDIYLSVWLLSFFKRVYFLGFTIPQSKHKNNSQN